jgi:hypothetical protein
MVEPVEGVKGAGKGVPDAQRVWVERRVHDVHAADDDDAADREQVVAEMVQFPTSIGVKIPIVVAESRGMTAVLVARRSLLGAGLEHNREGSRGGDYGPLVILSSQSCQRMLSPPTLEKAPSLDKSAESCELETVVAASRIRLDEREVADDVHHLDPHQSVRLGKNLWLA